MTLIDSSFQPVVPDMEARIRSSVSKYTRPSDPTFEREWSAASPQARRALQSLDAERLKRGQRVLSQPQSAVGLRAATTGESAIGDPDEGLWGDFTRNVQEFTSGLPRLPQALVKEVRDLPTVPQRFKEAVAEGDNPIEDLGNIAQIPGVRMVPGAFVAGQFGSDGAGVKGLVDNPLFTALDVLPFASKAAGLTKTVRAAEALAAPGQRVGKFSTLAKYGRPSGPILDEAAGTLTRNAFGRATERAAARAAETRPGAGIKEMWGKRTGDIMQQANRSLAEVTDPKIAASPRVAELIEIREQVAKAGADLDPARASTLAAEAKMGRLTDDAIEALPGAERDYVRLAQRLDQRMLEFGEESGDLARRQVRTPGGGMVEEVFTAPQARRIDKARATRDRFGVLASTAEDLGTRAPADLPTVQAALSRSLDTPLTVRERGWVLRSQMARLELAGYKTGGWRKRLNKITKADEMERFHREFAALDDLPRVPDSAIPSLPDRATLQALARVDPMVRSFLDLTDAGAWSKAAKRAKDLASRKTVPSAIAADIDWTLARRFAQRQAKIDEALSFAETNRVASLSRRFARQAERVEEASIPARWMDVSAVKIRDQLGSRIADLQAAGKVSADDAAKASELIALEVLDAPSLPQSVRSELHNVAREVRANWKSWADEGLDPQFVHRTRRSRVGQAPQVRPGAMSASDAAFRERVFDFGSTVNDWMVAIDARAFDMLSREVSVRVGDWIVDSFARDLSDIKADLTPFARDIVARKPGLSPGKVMDDLVARNWREITTHSGTHYVPRDVAGTWEKMGPKAIDSAFMATYDKAMGVFRTALLPLSPRWHLYNVVGGAIMTTAEQGFGVWRHMPRAWKIARSGGLEGIADLPSMGAKTRAIREAAQWSRGLDVTTPVGKASALWDMAAGKFLARMWNESEAVAKVKRGGSAGIARSYAMNEMFDDMFRSMSYLQGEGKALRAGMSVADAQAVGVGAARRVLVNWDRLTPIERSVIRNIFPFYSWSKHLLGYTARFPFDHPLRTAVTASLVQAELEDFGTGLPQSLFSLIDVTAPARLLGADPRPGEKVMLNMDGMNPFRDVASWASLVSFMGSAATGNIDSSADIGAVSSQSSPAIQILLGMVGVDPAEGVPDPYQQVTLDPRTGQLKPVNEFNPIAAIPQSLVPQTRILNDVLGVNRDFQRLLQSNPEAAKRRLFSSTGMPITVLPRWVDQPKETLKAEVRRYEDVSRTESMALRSGNLELMDRYPAILGATRRRLEQARRRGALDIDEDEINAAVGLP